MKETKYDRKLNDELSSCLDCKERFLQERDIQLCDDCISNYDLNKLWDLHDNNKLCALDFNESESMRTKFRRK